MSPDLPEQFSFTRYLAAKKSVDDRALNRQVWDSLARNLRPASRESPVNILEVGAGIGTMIERFIEWDLVRYAHYTAVDSSSENIEVAVRRLQAWASERGMQASPSERSLVLQDGNHLFRISFEVADLDDFLASHSASHRWDLLVAHAFLDLVDVPATLPALFGMLTPEGVFLFSINYDGLSILEPGIDPVLDRLVLDLYHRTMDERRIAGELSGDSRTGRHLFQHLKTAGAEILSSGASDWVVYAGPQGYPEDGAYFLSFIIHTIEQALTGHPELEKERFDHWIKERQAQIGRGELVYIAHQIDFFGRVGANITPGEL